MFHKATVNKSSAQKSCLIGKFSIISFFCWFISSSVSGQQFPSQAIIKTACFKSTGLKPTDQYRLSPQIPEGSGLAAWNGKIWTHNDSGPARIYALDSSSGEILNTFDLPGVKNNDWEDITQDAHFLYIGDFGNNNGRKKRLHIYRINKEALLHNKVALDSLSFEWPEVNDRNKKQTINFDCEAMLVMNDSIFLFTKEWKKKRQSRIFKLPATTGSHTAEYVATIKTRTLITGAHLSVNKKRLILCGYSLFLKPRLLVFTMPDTGSFKDLEKGVKIRIKKRLKQIEGITSFDGDEYYLISEATNFFLWKNKPTLYRIRIE